MSQIDTMDEYEKRIIRTALLDAQSEWLTEADKADSVTGRTIAVVIADAFSQEAEKYKKEKNFNDNGTDSPSDWIDKPAGDGEVSSSREGS